MVTAQQLIRWKLNTVMADRRMTNIRLAEIIGMNPISVSRLRTQDTLPKIGGETLEKLCRALDCKPADLIELADD